MLIKAVWVHESTATKGKQVRLLDPGQERGLVGLAWVGQGSKKQNLLPHPRQRVRSLHSFCAGVISRSRDRQQSQGPSRDTLAILTGGGALGETLDTKNHNRAHSYEE
ncbi:hypothetical protein SKAU_G00409940 [Synaphobranchus kaupii]|uniref:Uncharacterized protein n=1 Tax=Synaphobranchus kaupii TaxID=118154 RepID=A0A9Q1IAU6_SYNKA|nr:hypothetical protein SKAU_G00409940 [Synaphobranchus kaupii]